MVKRRIPVPDRCVEPPCRDLEGIAIGVLHDGSLDLDGIAGVPSRERDLAEERELVVDVGDH